MKKILFLILSLVLALSMVACDLSGGGGDTSVEDTLDTDQYGYKRQKNSWIADTLILPGMYPLENLFGESGKSGILSEYAIENNGKFNLQSTNYLVVLCYGAPNVDYLNTNLRFILTGESGVLYDEECVTVGSPLLYGIPIESFDMTASPSSRLRIKGGSSIMQGAVVIPFTVKPDLGGTLNAYCTLDTPSNVKNYYVNGFAEAQLGGEKADAEIKIDNIEVGYIDDNAYNGGDFSDRVISKTPSFGNGPCYMVLDILFTPMTDNDGVSLNCYFSVPDEDGDSLTLEEAPTANLERLHNNGRLSFNASYTVPRTTGEQKSVRMIVRMNSESLLSGAMELFLYSKEGATLKGTTTAPNVFAGIELEPEEPPVIEEIIPEEEPEKERMSTGAMIAIAITTVVLLSLMAWGVHSAYTPSDFCGRLVWSQILIYPLAILAMMLIFTTWSWWVVMILDIVVVLLTLFIDAVVLSMFEEEDGIYGMSIFYIMIAIPFTIFTTWSWWQILLATLLFAIISFIIEATAMYSISEAVGKFTLTCMSMMIGFFAAVLLAALTPWAWWAVMLASSGVVLVGALITAPIGIKS